MSVPDDVSVVGFDDSALAAFATPALTSVRVDYAEFGAAAAAALLAAIAGEPAAGLLAVGARVGRARLDRLAAAPVDPERDQRGDHDARR